MNRFSILRHLYPALRDHQQVEHTLNQLLHHTLDGEYIQNKRPKLRLMSFFQRNFFSILFLSIYRSLGVAPQRSELYGVINQSSRGIVTGTDNLLDDENKTMLPLAFPEQAHRFNSVMHILLFDRFLEQVLEKAVDDAILTREDKDRIHRRIFSALVPIGAEEASEEGGVKEILTPEKILSTVHALKGGELLRLAFITPCHIENTPQIHQADRGIYKIGLALQVIDDMTDLFEDLTLGHHNYLTSFIYHEGPADEQKRLAQLSEEQSFSNLEIHKLFPVSTRLVMHRAIGEALEGFTILHDAGFWLTRKDSFSLIKDLFELRGLAALLPLWPNYQPSMPGLPTTTPQADSEST